MKRKAIIATSMLLSLGVSVQVFSQEEDGVDKNKFNKVDQLIDQLSQMAGVESLPPSTFLEPSNKTLKPKNSDASLVNIVAPAIEVVKSDVDGVERIDSSDLQPEEIIKPEEEKVKLSELPPKSRFVFNQNLFVPAHKAGIIFTNGSPHHAIETGVDHHKILVNWPAEQNVCILQSNKSNVAMRGIEAQGRPQTFLDVSSADFSFASDSGGPKKVIATVVFKPKPVPNMEGLNIEIFVSCRLSEELLKNDLKHYTLGDLNDGFGDLFTFVLPQFIEI
jgi:hypothetical protein